MKIEKLTMPSQRELFIRKIQEMILSGEWPVQHRIPPERELAEKMGVSRTIVNTGIAVLESQGFLEVIPRQGIFVADYQKTASVETLNAIMRLKGDVLSDNDIRSVLEIRWALEKLTTRKALDRVTDEQLEKLREIVEQIRTAESCQEAAESALLFQRELAQLGENPMLALIIITFRVPCVAMWQRFCRIYGIEVLYRHTLKSWELLKQRDYEAALEWIEQFTREALDGKYTLYDKDVKGIQR
jgi:DNA-binding FadR family transcriptional regulator